MYKAKQRMKTLLLACFAALVSMLLAVALWVTPTSKIDASAADTTIEFTLGANGSASHADGTSKTSYTETVSDYTLTLTDVSNFYTGARDAEGNSCIKLGASKKTGGFSFTVPDDVTSVVIAVAQYKANTTKITVNGTSYTIATASDNGAYTDITVDTSSTKTVSLTTVSGGYRAMVNTITYVIAGSGSENPETPACEHANQTTTTVDATCTVAGSTTVTCKDCGETVSTEEIPALGHNIENGEPVNNENGTHSTTGVCSRCGEEETVTVPCEYEKANNENDVTYTCTICGYNYSVEKYTITYVVPDGIEAINAEKAEANSTITLKDAGTIEGYTFVGWATEELAEKTEDIPEYLPADTEYTVTEDIELYALYSYAEGTGAWTLVTDVATLAVEKEIVIVASGSNYALGTTQNSNNRGQAEINKDDNTVSFESDTQIISLESGTADGTFAFKVSDGYLYAASSSKNYLRTQTTNNANGFWLITVDSEGIATIKAQGSNTNNWLRYNSSSKIFSCYASGQADVSIYMKDGATYYVTEFNTCAHTNTDEVIEEATCTESGSRTVTCLDCDSVIEAEILPALGHNYIDGICDNCGEQDPTSIVYDGYYYLILNSKYLDSTTLDKNDRYKPVDFTPDENIEIKYVFYFIKNGEIYNMYDFSNGLYMENVTLTTNNNYTVNIYNAEGNILSHNTTANYVGFYKTTNNYPKDFTFTQVDLSATIDSASITIGEDITMNYKVTMSDVFAEAIMYFTVEEKTYEVSGEKVGERYVFSLEIPPHLMASNISAELKLGEQVLASMAEYSVKTYAQNQLNNSPSDKLKQLLTDLLYYGDAAYNYANETTDETPVTNGVENIGTASTAAPATTDFKLENMLEENATYPAYFLGAGVYFDNVNKIYVKLSTTENVTLTINGVAVEVTGDTVYTDGILATGFAETYTFVLSCNGEEMQTLTYSVNAYVYAMKDKGNAMAALAIALYNYGESAKAYKA